MAERRMFCKSVVLSDEFLDMPTSTRCLYLVLSMIADDDGFVNSPKSAMRQSSATVDDMNILIAKKYVIMFDSSLLVIKHWKMNNYIQKDRYTETKYIEQKQTLYLDENKAYTQNLASAKYTVYGTEIDDVYKLDTQVSIGKVSTTTTNNNNQSFLQSKEYALFHKVCQAFSECGAKSNPQDFIAYNDARDWKGIGGENVLDDLVRYVDRWERHEISKRGNKQCELGW